MSETACQVTGKDKAAKEQTTSQAKESSLPSGR